LADEQQSQVANSGLPPLQPPPPPLRYQCGLFRSVGLVALLRVEGQRSMIDEAHIIAEHNGTATATPSTTTSSPNTKDKEEHEVGQLRSFLDSPPHMRWRSSSHLYRGQQLRAVYSPFGVLCPAMFHNSVCSGAVVNLLTPNVRSLASFYSTFAAVPQSSIVTFPSSSTNNDNKTKVSSLARQQPSSYGFLPSSYSASLSPPSMFQQSPHLSGDQTAEFELFNYSHAIATPSLSSSSSCSAGSSPQSRPLRRIQSHLAALDPNAPNTRTRELLSSSNHVASTLPSSSDGATWPYTSMAHSQRPFDSISSSVVASLTSSPALYLTDARCMPGSEGGGVFDIDGQLIGMVTLPLRHASSTSVIEYNFIISCDALLAWLWSPTSLFTTRTSSSSPSSSTSSSSSVTTMTRAPQVPISKSDDPMTSLLRHVPLATSNVAAHASSFNSDNCSNGMAAAASSTSFILNSGNRSKYSTSITSLSASETKKMDPQSSSLSSILSSGKGNGGMDMIHDEGHVRVAARCDLSVCCVRVTNSWASGIILSDDGCTFVHLPPFYLYSTCVLLIISP
jgi:hypothetical protein